MINFDPKIFVQFANSIMIIAIIISCNHSLQYYDCFTILSSTNPRLCCSLYNCVAFWADRPLYSPGLDENCAGAIVYTALHS